MSTSQTVSAVKQTMSARAIDVTTAAKEIGMSRTNLSRFIHGKYGGVRSDTSDKICAWLNKWGNPVKALDQTAGAVDTSYVPLRKVGVYGVAHCMTHPILFGDSVPESDFDVPHVMVPDTLSQFKKLAAFRAADASMAPLILAGDLLFFSPDASLESGHLCLCKFDDQVVCKRYYRTAETITLKSDAPGVNPIILHPPEVSWIYRVLKSIRETDL